VPLWFRWQSAADAMGVLFLGHVAGPVRAAALRLLKLVRHSLCFLLLIASPALVGILFVLAFAVRK
jgi:hypothetical protein